MRKNKQIKELKEKLATAESNIRIQKNIISNLKEANAKLSEQNKKTIFKWDRHLDKIKQYEAPVKFIRCPERQTSYLVFADGHYKRIKLHKGDRPNNEVALVYLLAKNLYDIDKCQELIKNKIIIKPGEDLKHFINVKK